jgi:hypothetical protein
VSATDLLQARVRAFQAALEVGGKLPALAAKATRPPSDALEAAKAVQARLAEAYAKRRLARPT